MLIGKAGAATTSVSTADATSIEVRGRDLCADLIGRLGFTDYFFLLVTGREPSEDQRYFLDVLLVAIAEHGLTPTVQAARMTYAAAPEALQGAVAAGLLGAGSVVLGTADLCATLLREAKREMEAGADAATVAAAIALRVRGEGGKLPGFGHPLHRPKDPRTVRILALADERGVGGAHIEIARHLESAAERAWGRPLTMNVSMAIAAVLLDLDIPAALIRGVPLLARTAGLIAHLAEEEARPIGFLMASKAEDAIAYERDGSRAGS